MNTEHIERLVFDYCFAVDAARAEELNGRDGSQWWVVAAPLADELRTLGAEITLNHGVRWPQS